MLCAPKMPEIKIGLHCSDPYPCDFHGHCWKKIPEDSIFDLSRFPQKKMFALYNRGVVSLKKIPASVKLFKSQIIQIDGISDDTAVLQDTKLIPVWIIPLLKHGAAL